MEIGIVLGFLTLFVLGCSKIISFDYRVGTLDFDQSTTIKQVETGHINCPIILYSLVRIHTQSYFSFHVRYQTQDGYPNDKLKFYIHVEGVNQFSLSLQYLLIQHMPHLEITHVNLTWAHPSKIYHSRKSLIFNQNTFLSSHLIGFSSSEYAKDRYFYAIRGTTTYHFYTTMNLTTNNWVAMHVIILQSVYSAGGVLCFGNHMTIQTEISGDRAFSKLEIEGNLHFFIGLEAIYQAKSEFEIREREGGVVFSGTYSYSIVALNNSCIIEERREPELSEKGRVYFILMIVFMVLSAHLCIGFFVYCVCCRGRQSGKIFIEIELEGNIIIQDEQKVVGPLNRLCVLPNQPGSLEDDFWEQNPQRICQR